MTGNITEEQFRKFCKDFVEKYEGMNFQELIERLGVDCDTVYKGICNTSLTFIIRCYGLGFGDSKDDTLAFGYNASDIYAFINCYGGHGCNYFYTIEDLYKFFKMDYKETKEPSNISKVAFNIPIETIKEDDVEMLSKKHNINKESIELKIIM